MSQQILIVDDEPSIRKVLSAQLRREGYQVALAEDGNHAISWLMENPTELIISDLKMPGLDGMGLLNWVQETLPGVPLIMITAHGTIHNAVEAVKCGVFDYITKPFERSELLAAVQKGLATAERSEFKVLSGRARGLELLGQSSSVQHVISVVEKVAASPATVLIQGESGSGKDLVARALHDLSNRADKPFMEVNCGAVPAELFEAELFGSLADPNPGNVHTKPGRLELAEGGTLFLDEISELPPKMQVRLLRVLQDRVYEPGNGRPPIPVDVRIIAATHKSLDREVAEGRFREDLYYRLNVIPVTLAPLRDRKEDIPLLAGRLVEHFNQRFGTTIEGFTDEALSALCEHPWPGNLSELESVIERGVLLAEGPLLDTEDLQHFTAPTSLPRGQGEEGEQLGLKEYLRVHTVRLERARIQRALDADEGNVTRAARRLGISRRSLQTKMKEYGLRDR